MPTRRKINIADDDTLRAQLDTLYENASQVQLAQWALELTVSVWNKAGYPIQACEAVMQGFAVNQAWQNQQARMHDVRQAGFKIHALTKTTADPLFISLLRLAGQAVGTGHMREHAMVAADYAILY